MDIRSNQHLLIEQELLKAKEDGAKSKPISSKFTGVEVSEKSPIKKETSGKLKEHKKDLIGYLKNIEQKYGIYFDTDDRKYIFSDFKFGDILNIMECIQLKIFYQNNKEMGDEDYEKFKNFLNSSLKKIKEDDKYCGQCLIKSGKLSANDMKLEKSVNELEYLLKSKKKLK